MNDRGEEIARNLHEVRTSIASAADAAGRSPDEITLIVVTKTYPTSDLEILYQLGERNFGENRDDEGARKSAELPSDITWHFQGQIQSKKIGSLLHWADYVHSLDNLVHAAKIQRRLESAERQLKVFLQLNVDSEFQSSRSVGNAVPHSGRGGLPPSELMEFTAQVATLDRIDIQGLMVVAPPFASAADAFAVAARIRSAFLEQFPRFQYFSAGMSGDYREAIGAGATHVRVGSSILGVRSAPN